LRCAAAPRQTSAEGFELRFAVNYLVGFLLTLLLLPLIKNSAPARIVNVSPAGQQPIDFGDVMLTRGYNGTRAYCQSKLAQIMFTIDLGAALEGTGVTVSCRVRLPQRPNAQVPARRRHWRCWAARDECHFNFAHAMTFQPCADTVSTVLLSIGQRQGRRSSWGRGTVSAARGRAPRGHGRRPQRLLDNGRRPRGAGDGRGSSATRHDADRRASP
jgi:hypothetical protein